MARALEICAAGLESGDNAPLMAHFAGAREAVSELEERFLPSSRS
jgi:hypothetical protein